MAVKVGIMSFAHIHALGYARNLSEIPEAELIGIADDDVERGGSAADRLQVDFFPTYKALLEQDLDAVIIASENAKHRELTILAAEAGKHVLCEKPMATSVEDAEAMITACERQGVKLMIAFPCRYSPSMVRVKEEVDGGCIGDILAVTGTDLSMTPGGWFTDQKKSGGGGVLDRAVEAADLMRWVLRSEPVEVYAEINNLMNHADYEDCGLLTITWANGVFSTLKAGWAVPKSYPVWGDVRMEIMGQNGVISADLFAQDITHYSDESARVIGVNWGSDIDYGMIKDFVVTVMDDLPVTISGDDGLAALKVALAAYRSAHEGGVVRVSE